MALRCRRVGAVHSIISRYWRVSARFALSPENGHPLLPAARLVRWHHLLTGAAGSQSTSISCPPVEYASYAPASVERFLLLRVQAVIKRPWRRSASSQKPTLANGPLGPRRRATERSSMGPKASS